MSRDLLLHYEQNFQISSKNYGAFFISVREQWIKFANHCHLLFRNGKNRNLVKRFMYLNQFSSDLEVKNSSQFLDDFGHSVARQIVVGSHSSYSPNARSDVDHYISQLLLELQAKNMTPKC